MAGGGNDFFCGKEISRLRIAVGSDRGSCMFIEGRKSNNDSCRHKQYRDSSNHGPTNYFTSDDGSTACGRGTDHGSTNHVTSTDSSSSNNATDYRVLHRS